MKNIIRLLYRYFKKLTKTLYFNIAKYFSNKYLTESTANARKKLSNFSPNPNTSALSDNEAITPFSYDLQIIIPAYNVEAYIKECLDSVLNQKTKYNVKVVLIDDGSTDKTGEIINSYSDARLEVIHQENRGFSGARNRGLEKIYAKYIMFVDSDDYIDCEMYSTMMKYAETGADIVEIGCRLINIVGKVIRTTSFNEETIIGERECVIHYLKQKNTTNYLWNKLYKKDLLCKNDFIGLRFSEDFYVNVHTHARAKLKVIVPLECYNYVIHAEQNTSLQKFSLARTDSIKAGKLVIKDFKKDKQIKSLAGIYVCNYYVYFAHIIKKQNYSEWKEYMHITNRDLLYCLFNTKINLVENKSREMFKKKALMLFLLKKKYFYFEWLIE